ncbi:hypothetical protein [Jatrophihabitans lederbergiae]|uniref:Uncharacterized protein n=1 Tax=Jatrophihabitans lederbergiae TaxID=3075547 RepID=A0ABU2JDG7_9ACTN|nr:hypothetical protein [Jatrophihabitans sp. DSM 44399]MDT0262519.1 hypothetical protein [Jatrophihabitans sp. DSM 44399]
MAPAGPHHTERGSHLLSQTSADSNGNDNDNVTTTDGTWHSLPATGTVHAGIGSA